MTDKNVQRNVRSSGKEGLQTPSQKHEHVIGEHGNVGFVEKGQTGTQRDALLEKFRRRERAKKSAEPKSKPKQQER